MPVFLVVAASRNSQTTLTVNDLSNEHNFHLAGAGVNKKTSVGGKGKVTRR